MNAWKNVRCQMVAVVMVAVPGFWLGSRFLFDVMTARFFTSRQRVLTSPWRGWGGLACSVPCRAGPCLLHEPPPVFPGDTHTKHSGVALHEHLHDVVPRPPRKRYLAWSAVPVIKRATFIQCIHMVACVHSTTEVQQQNICLTF